MCRGRKLCCPIRLTQKTMAGGLSIEKEGVKSKNIIGGYSVN